MRSMPGGGAQPCPACIRGDRRFDGLKPRVLRRGGDGLDPWVVRCGYGLSLWVVRRGGDGLGASGGIAPTRARASRAGALVASRG